MIQTEYPFTLPIGFPDEDGALEREGIMRLATAADEILPLKDPRVQANPAYLIIILLSRVVTRLGSLPQVNPKIIENLYAADLAYLQDLYNRINRYTGEQAAACPHCGQALSAEAAGPGGFMATPSNGSTRR